MVELKAMTNEYSINKINIGFGFNPQEVFTNKHILDNKFWPRMRRFEYFTQIELKTQSKKRTINHTNTTNNHQLPQSITHH